MMTSIVDWENSSPKIKCMKCPNFNVFKLYLISRHIYQITNQPHLSYILSMLIYFVDYPTTQLGVFLGCVMLHTHFINWYSYNHQGCIVRGVFHTWCWFCLTEQISQGWIYTHTVRSISCYRLTNHINMLFIYFLLKIVHVEKTTLYLTQFFNV